MACWMRWFLQRRYPVAILLLFGARLVVPLPLTFAETPPASIQYVYDELNRLIAVIDRENNAARYVYDAVGNILAIERANVGDRLLPGMAAELVERQRDLYADGLLGCPCGHQKTVVQG